MLVTYIQQLAEFLAASMKSLKSLERKEFACEADALSTTGLMPLGHQQLLIQEKTDRLQQFLTLAQEGAPAKPASQSEPTQQRHFSHHSHYRCR